MHTPSLLLQLVISSIDDERSHAVVKLGKMLFPLFALALDLPENFFEDKVRPEAGREAVTACNVGCFQTTKPAAIMRLLYYPPQNGTVDDRVLGIGAHTECVFNIV